MRIGPSVFCVNGARNRIARHAAGGHTRQDVIAACTQARGIQEFAFLLKPDFLGGRTPAYAAHENRCQKKLPHGCTLPSGYLLLERRSSDFLRELNQKDIPTPD